MKIFIILSGGKKRGSRNLGLLRHFQTNSMKYDKIVSFSQGFLKSFPSLRQQRQQQPIMTFDIYEVNRVPCEVIISMKHFLNFI